jgi:hypothetical protein
MTRALRRWLLGASAEGPPLLADPLYRWEVRRYWTWRRYLGTALAVLALWPLAALGAVAFATTVGVPGSPGGWVIFLVVLSLLGRLPLSFAASTGAALAIVSERVSSQLEQLVMTPVDSWRFCLARYFGRLRGLAPYWLAGGVCYLAFLLVLDSTLDEPIGMGSVLLVLGMAVAMHLDAAVMIGVDAAVGMHFTATARSTPAALIKTYLLNFALIPFIMVGLPIACANYVQVLVTPGWGYQWEPLGAVYLLSAVLVRAAGGALVARYMLGQARAAMHRTFSNFEAGA